MTELTLSQKQRIFPLRIARLIEELPSLGYEVAFAEAYRSPEQADQNAAKGIGIKNSLHTLRLAIDLLLFKDGIYLTKSEDYKLAGDFWKSLSWGGAICCWGGDFAMPDGDHFSIEHNGVR